MRKQHYLIMVLLTILNLNLNAQVAVNTTGQTADGSAMLDVSSTEKGILIPRLNLSQRNAISNPVTGLMIFQTDNTPGFYFYNGTAWVVIGDGATSINSLHDGITDSYSLFLGEGAGAADDGTDNRNTAVGINAYNASVSGYANTAFGNEALKLNTTGTHNAVFGTQALTSNLTGIENTVIGTNSGFNVTGSGNILIGFNAAFSETDISNKLYIDNSSTGTPLLYGDFSTNLLRINGTLDINNAYQLPTTDGTSGQTLKTDGSGSLTWSSDIGATSLNDLSDAATDNNSLFLGVDAGANDDGTTNFNTGTGVWSLKEVTSGSHNSALGTTALQNLTTGSQNTALGTGALNSNSSGSDNTAVGKEAGKDVTGSGNIFIGNEAAKTQTDISNKLYIDNSDTIAPLIYGDFENDTVKINAHFDVSRTMSIDSGSIIGQLAINTDGSTPDESSILDLKSTTKGLLLPRMYTYQILHISNPAAGLMVFDIDSSSFYGYSGSKWISLWDSDTLVDVCGGNSFEDSRDGRIYTMVTIGTQCWMAENLNIGTRISSEDNPTDNSIIEKWCYFDDETKCTTNGGLYHWDEMMQYVTAEGVQGICPSGWHIPTDAEYKTMEMVLGMSQSDADGLGNRGTDQGGKMKEIGTTHWWSPNTLATNASGFTAFAGGFRISNGHSSYWGRSSIWWSSNESNGGALIRSLNYDNGQVYRYHWEKAYGLSVRCIKD